LIFRMGQNLRNEHASASPATAPSCLFLDLSAERLAVGLADRHLFVALHEMLCASSMVEGHAVELPSIL